MLINKEALREIITIFTTWITNWLNFRLSINKWFVSVQIHHKNSPVDGRALR
jgi:hypothetical protein